MLAIRRVAQFIESLDFDTLPADVVDECKRQVLDAITTVIAAHSVSGGRMAAEVGTLMGGNGRSTILGAARPTCASASAFANTQMSISLDLGSNLFFSQGLQGLVIFPALALAEERGLSGRALIESVAAGFEVGGRVGLSFPPPHWPSRDGKTISGDDRPRNRWIIFGAGASVARILGLPTDGAVHVLAMAGDASPPPPSGRLYRGKWSMSKYGMAGLLAAAVQYCGLLAERGFTADERLLDDEDGFHAAQGSALHDRDALTRDLGQRWVIREANFKRYPSGTHNQQALHAFAELLSTQNLTAERIESVVVGRAIGTSGPFANINPETYVEAQFSLPFGIAALAHGIPAEEWPTAVASPGVADLAQRVVLRVDDEAVQEFTESWHRGECYDPWRLRSRVEVRGAEGVARAWSDYGRVTTEELANKCRMYLAATFEARRVEEVITAVDHLEELTDVTDLTRLLVPASSPAAS